MFFAKHRFTWLVITLVILAAVPRLLTYTFSLPFIDHPDEPAFTLAALHWRDVLPSPPEPTVGYPPGIIIINYLVHQGLQPFIEVDTNVAAVIQGVRLVSIGLGLLTLVLIMHTARMIGGDYAGLIAGIAYLFSPALLREGVYATGDPGAVALTALAVWLACLALLKPQYQPWCIWSVSAGLAATLFKYPVVPAIAAGGAVALWIFIRENRKRGFYYLLLQAALVGAVAFFLWFIYDVSGFINYATPLIAYEDDNTFDNLLNMQRVYGNFYYTLYLFDVRGFWLIIGSGAIAYGFAWQRQLPRLNLMALGLVTITAIGLIWLSAGFVEITEVNRPRDAYPALILIFVMVGAALAQIVFTFSAWLQVRQPQWLQIGVALPLLIILIPQAQEQLDLVRDRMRPDRRADMMTWMDVTLPAGDYISAEANHKTFAAGWGGYRGRHYYHHAGDTPLTRLNLEDWRANRVEYALVDYAEYETLPASYLENMLLIKAYPPDDDWRGPETVIFRLYPPQHEASGEVGGLHLVGYDLDQTTVQAGDNLTFRLYWQPHTVLAGHYTVYNHLVPLDSREVLAQVDSLPYNEAEFYRPTTTWTDPGETLISPFFTMTLNADVPPGRYRLITGFYQRDTGVRLLSAAGADYIVVAEIEVTE